MKRDSTLPTGEADALGYFNADGWYQQPNGTFLVEAGCAQDQADMCAGQLSSLLLLMRLDDARSFRNINEGHQLNLMWLASQLADELKDLLPLVGNEARQEAKA